jgi:L-2-hydroxyglutarate oxidase
MTPAPLFDVAVIGGGIVGTATAMSLIEERRLSLVVLEAEDHLAAHQSGRNSGVIHSGLYYKPGSLKARNCVEGRREMYRFCQENDLPHERCGKVVVAVTPNEVAALDELERRGRANGLEGLKRLRPEEIREREPHTVGVDGLLVPETGIADYARVTEAYGRRTRDAGGEVRTGCRVLHVLRRGGEFVLETPRGAFRCRHLINCAGLQSDRVARLCGVDPGVQVIPFRGEYYELVPARQSLVKHLIYPVPNPLFPFLGVHFTRMVGGGIEAGPNAVLALKREGYTLTSISLRDTGELLSYPGFWRMAAKYWTTGLGEIYRSISKAAFLRSLQKLIPELRSEDIHPGRAGVRAQAVDRQGNLVDDFRIVEAEGMIHVLNAPSPAATASISIGRSIAQTAARNFNLPRRAGAAVLA